MVSFSSLALLALAQLATSQPTSPPPAFQVTNLYTFEPTGRPGDTSPYRVFFNVTDPSDSSKASCEARWPYSQRDTGYPTTYLANCTDPSWAFKFVNWVRYDDFTLDVKHTSNSHGKKTTRFAKGKVGYDIITCGHSGSGFSVCNQIEGKAFPLPVYDVKN